MANKDKNTAQQPEGELIAVKHPFYTKPWVIITAAVLAVVLIVSMLVGVSMSARGITLGQLITDEDVRDQYFSWLFGYELKNIDFINDDLSKFIEISDEIYKGYDLTVSVSRPGELELENKILQLLASNRDVQNVDRRYMLNVPITAGDAVYMYYTGYQLNEAGERVDISGTSNFDLSVDELKASGGVKIGGGSLIPGFELALVGKVPKDYNTDFTKIIGGNLPKDGVPENCVVYATASYVMEDGLLYEDEKIRIDFRDGKAEDKWGVGIYDYLCEKSIGMTNTAPPLTLTCADGNKITYTRMTVEYFTQCENDPLVIETTFPEDYDNASLRGKTVYFDIYFYGVVIYNTPEFNDDFILNTLKVSEDSLAELEGEGVTEKYKTFLMNELLAAYEEKVHTAAEDAMWEYLKKTVKIKKMPSREVNRIYENYYYDIMHDYRSANADGAGYESLDEYARDALGLDIGADWTEYIMMMTEDEVKEKLIFYTIIRNEGLVPTEEEFKVLYRKELELDFEYYYGKTSEDYESYEEFEQALFSYEKEMLDAIGVSYYHDAIYYNYATDNILEFANIINTAVSEGN